MEVIFPPTMANANDFPELIIKATPKIQLNALRLTTSINKNPHYLLTRNGRGAMGLAGQKLQYKDRKNIVLIPAYHCPALVEPFICLNYEVRFYPLLPDLTVDLEAFKRLLEDDVTHCVAIRYFGFNQNIQQLIETAQQKNVLVIEDCAHALFDFFDIGSRDSSQSDAKICSINKLLPSIDGGVLYYQGDHVPPLRYRTWMEEFKGILYLTGLTLLINSLRKKLKRPNDSNDNVEMLKSHADSSPKLRYFSHEDLTSGGYRHTGFVLRHSNFSNIIQKRRDNFAYIVQRLSNTSVGVPLYTHAGNSVPYVVPFLLSNESYFANLRKKGIQVLRWEEVALSDCEVSQDYRKRLIQLPCHQQLLRSELDTIIQAITSLEHH
tara:strand:- start:1199 stop:2335 length:1137 start_codon:yes stop_codon:yes gene_type:complete